MNTQPSAAIRLYNPGDDQSLREIAYLTASEQNKIAGIIGDQDLVSLVLVEGYMRLEPESLFVAEVEGKVVGYITGCADSAAFVRRYIFKIFPRVALLFFRSKAFLKKEIYFYFARSTWQTLLHSRKRSRAVEGYPAHCHINFLPGYRQLGLGGSLMTRLIDRLREIRVPGIHLATATEAGKKFFLKNGFKTELVLPSTDSLASEEKELWIMVKKI